jgi:alpha-D-ribose 1-methylphosphonate 5-triphosphate diphosphatase
MSETILANATLVLPNEVIHGAIRIENGHITAIDPGRSVLSGATDCEGDLVMPGLIVPCQLAPCQRHYRP